VLNHDFSVWGTLVGGGWAYRSDRAG
jgi:hypothetical protein